MSRSQISRFPFAKIVAILAAAFGIGVGLCGLDYFLAARNIGRSHREFGVGPLDSFSMIVMAFSAAGLVLALVAWAIAAAVITLRSSGKN
jgi:hypothetical protein